MNKQWFKNSTGSLSLAQNLKVYYSPIDAFRDHNHN